VADSALLQSNVVRLDRDEITNGNSLTYTGSGLRTFDNASPDGKVILARDRGLGTGAEELVQAIQAANENVMAASFLK
jgi:hypothetical protein